MPVTKVQRESTVKKFQRSKTDTGSPEVQIALLTERINYLTGHFKMHVKDHHSRHGLMMMVAKRKRQLDYLRDTDPGSYQRVIDALGLRK